MLKNVYRRIDIKKIGIVLLCGMILLAMGGCSGGGGTSGLSEEMKELGIAAVEIADDFLDGDITGDAAIERLENNYSSASRLYDQELEEAESETLVRTDHALDISVPIHVQSLKMSIREKSRGTGTDKDVLEDRNKLAEMVNKKER